MTGSHDLRPADSLDVLVCSVTAGYRHENIETGNETIRNALSDLARRTGTTATVTVVDDSDGDASAFPSTPSALDAYDCVAFNNTTGAILDSSQRSVFEEYVREGGGWVGIHAAADTAYDWPFYGELLGGAYFDSHPSVQRAEVVVTDRTHPTTAHLPARWRVTDEWYDFVANPRGDVHVLATVDEETYAGATMSRADHPIAWCRTVGDGHAWYTGRGHTDAAWAEADFVEHVAAGILWASGFVDNGDTATD